MRRSGPALMPRRASRRCCPRPRNARMEGLVSDASQIRSTTAPCRSATHLDALSAPARLRYPAGILFAHSPAIRSPPWQPATRELRPSPRRPARWVREIRFPHPFGARQGAGPLRLRRRPAPTRITGFCVERTNLSSARSMRLVIAPPRMRAPAAQNPRAPFRPIGGVRSSFGLCDETETGLGRPDRLRGRRLIHRLTHAEIVGVGPGLLNEGRNWLVKAKVSGSVELIRSEGSFLGRR